MNYCDIRVAIKVHNMGVLYDEHDTFLLTVLDGMIFINVIRTKPFPFVPGFVGILVLQPEIASEVSL